MSQVLFFAAHPDDIEGLLSGTAIGHVRAGDNCIEAIMTRGERGALLPKNRNAQLGAIREKEGRAGGNAMGMKEVLFFDFLDAGLRNTPRLRDVVRQLIVTYKPDIIYAPEFYKSAYPHRDHIELGAAIWEVWMELSTKSSLRFFHPSMPTHVYSVEKFVTERQRLLGLHRSQRRINSFINIAAHILMPGKIMRWKRQAGSKYFEMYREADRADEYASTTL